MEVRKLVGWNIRRLRLDRGLTIEALAGEADVSPAYLGQLERGRENVGIVLLDRLSRALGAELSDLVAKPQPSEELTRTSPARRRPKKEPPEHGREPGHAIDAVRDLVLRDLKRAGLSTRPKKDGIPSILTEHDVLITMATIALEATAPRRWALLQLRNQGWLTEETAQAIDRLLASPSLGTDSHPRKRAATKASQARKVK